MPIAARKRDAHSVGADEDPEELTGDVLQVDREHQHVAGWRASPMVLKARKPSPAVHK